MAIITHLRRKHHQPPPPSGGLSDTNLLVRYYLDEGADGATTPTTANDDGPSSMDLTIDFGTSAATWIETSGNRGLDFIGRGGDALASHSIGASGNVIRDNLNGSNVVTFEYVAQLDAPNASWGRVFGTAPNNGNGSCVIQARGGPQGLFRYNGGSAAETWTWTTGTRDVWHIVVDTTQAAADDRVIVYKNGSTITSTVGTGVTQNDTISIGTTEWIILMNRETDNARQTDGKMYYAAMYNEAFSSTRVSDHYDVLTLDDDTP